MTIEQIKKGLSVMVTTPFYFIFAVETHSIIEVDNRLTSGL